MATAAAQAQGAMIASPFGRDAVVRAAHTPASNQRRSSSASKHAIPNSIINGSGIAEREEDRARKETPERYAAVGRGDPPAPIQELP